MWHVSIPDYKEFKVKVIFGEKWKYKDWSVTIHYISSCSELGLHNLWYLSLCSHNFLSQGLVLSYSDFDQSVLINYRVLSDL